jgi:murein L,D-transpeptidase YcbB/YkuD
MKLKNAMHGAAVVSLALMLSPSYAGDYNKTTNDTSATNTQESKPMNGKQKATAIGAGTGAVAGAVVGGPVGAVVGAGIGAYVGHEGTDANGKTSSTTSASASDSTVRDAQAALNSQGYSAGMVDGRWGPSTQNAVRRFQSDRGLEQSGTLDNATLSALGVTKS